MHILFVSSWLPFGSNNGSRLRARHLLQALSDRHDVSLISFAEPEEMATPVPLSFPARMVGIVEHGSFRANSMKSLLGLLSRKPRSVIDTFSPEMAALISAEIRTNTYDVIVASELDAAEHLPVSVSVPCVLDEVQVGLYRGMNDGATAVSKRMRQGLTWIKTSRYIKDTILRFALCTAASEVEAGRLRIISPNFDHLAIVPNGVDTRRFTPLNEAPTSPILVYNGSLTFSANFDAMRHFVREIWPRVLTGWPSAPRDGSSVPELRITGSHKGVDLSLIRARGVVFTGYVDDIASEVRRARVCVVPLRIGGGTRLKILEAMALGTPVVSTSKGAEGLEVTDGKNILIADDPQAFAQHVLRLLADDELRWTIARSARALVEANYDWGAIGQQFCNLVESVAARKTIDGST